jgi:trehalose synthase
LQEVRLAALPFDPVAEIIGVDRANGFTETVVPDTRKLLEGRSVLNVNSTSKGGGVVELLRGLLGYVRAFGIDARWVVIDGDPEFFTLTKRIHNHLYGTPGDGGPLGAEEHELFERVGRENSQELAAVCRPGDIVVLHDPQPASLARWFHDHGALVVWRCHVGIDHQNDFSEQGWTFLRPYLEPYVSRYVFSVDSFAPDWVPRDRLDIIPPSLDPLSPKNRPMDQDSCRAILAHTGLIAGPSREDLTFIRADGSPGRIEHYADVVRTGPPPDPDTPLVVQVSRWDRLKDMQGVLEGFASHALDDHGAQLVLAGPSVSAVADDPEGAAVLQECTDAWRRLPHGERSRVHLACLPMTDPEENAAIVNALQRHATVVVQKSLAEGFGLTVAEAMYKGKPVIASRVGGISVQIEHGVSGLLIDDPSDRDEFVRALDHMLGDREDAARMGANARASALERFLADRHLAQWLQVCQELIRMA